MWDKKDNEQKMHSHQENLMEAISSGEKQKPQVLGSNLFPATSPKREESQKTETTRKQMSRDKPDQQLKQRIGAQTSAFQINKNSTVQRLATSARRTHWSEDYNGELVTSYIIYLT